MNKVIIDACISNKNELNKFINWFNTDFVPETRYNDSLITAYIDAILEVLDTRMPGIGPEITAKGELLFAKCMED